MDIRSGSMVIAISSVCCPIIRSLPISGIVRSLEQTCLAYCSSSRGLRCSLSTAINKEDVLPKSSMTTVCNTPAGSAVFWSKGSPALIFVHAVALSCTELRSMT